MEIHEDVNDLNKAKEISESDHNTLKNTSTGTESTTSALDHSRANSSGSQSKTSTLIPSEVKMTSDKQRPAIGPHHFELLKLIGQGAFGKSTSFFFLSKLSLVFYFSVVFCSKPLFFMLLNPDILALFHFSNQYSF
jgi:hypothetical protein